MEEAKSGLFIFIKTFRSIYPLAIKKNIFKLIINELRIKMAPPPGLRSVQFSRSVVSDYLRPHEPQHARPPCPSPIPGVY